MKTNQNVNPEIDLTRSGNEVYTKPTIEIIEMETESILASSGSDYEPGGGWGN